MPGKTSRSTLTVRSSLRHVATQGNKKMLPLGNYMQKKNGTRLGPDNALRQQKICFAGRHVATYSRVSGGERRTYCLVRSDPRGSAPRVPSRHNATTTAGRRHAMRRMREQGMGSPESGRETFGQWDGNHHRNPLRMSAMREPVGCRAEDTCPQCDSPMGAFERRCRNCGVCVTCG